MRYLKGILFILFVSIFQTSMASGPGFDGDDYDLGQAPYYGDMEKQQELDNIESIRRPVNEDKTVEIINDAHSNVGLKFGCDITPSIKISHVNYNPIKKTNNLIRKPGSAIKAKGQFIIVSGQVVDRDCLPISNAVINIWQADSAGKYIESYRLLDAWDVQDSDYDKNFAYSGSTQTNNLGEYNFITILPTSKLDNQAPHINIEVKHPDFADLSSRIYFNKHPRNDDDQALNELALEDQALVIAKGHPIDPMNIGSARQYDFNITLEGINKFRRY